MESLFDKRVGTTKRQTGRFQHTGRDHEQHSDGGVSTSLYTFIEAAKPEPIPCKLTQKLGKTGATSLRSVMGGLQYNSSERPDKLGKIAACMEALNNIEEQTWAAVDKANTVLQEIKDTNRKSNI